MQKKLWGLSVVPLVVTALVALPAAGASAATLTLATTLKALEVTPTTAFVTGLVYNDDAAAYWTFQYGTTTSYGKSTPVRTIAAGTPYEVVYWPLTGLTPNTTYHFRLAAQASYPYAAGYGYGYYTGSGVGADVTFKTASAGSIKLSSTTFAVSKGKAAFSLKCSSTIACKTKYSASYKGKYKGKTKTYTCFSGSSSLKAGASGKSSVKLSAACAYFVSHAKKQKLGGVAFSVTASTGQSKLSSKVTLKG